MAAIEDKQITPPPASRTEYENGERSRARGVRRQSGALQMRSGPCCGEVEPIQVAIKAIAGEAQVATSRGGLSPSNEHAKRTPESESP